MLRFQTTKYGELLMAIVSDDGIYSEFKEWDKQNERLEGEALLSKLVNKQVVFNLDYIVPEKYHK